MVLEKCEYVQPQMTSTGQVCEIIPKYPCNVCISYIKDILDMPLQPGLDKDISTGIMYLTNTTNKVKNLSVEFDIIVPIQGVLLYNHEDQVVLDKFWIFQQ
jgi:hypothetical protein